jgi:hypothetical protein
MLARRTWQFVKINAEKSPYLVEKLNVWVMPTLLLVKDGQVRLEPVTCSARRLPKMSLK